MSKAIVNYRIDPIEALDQLTAREKQVIEMRLGIGLYTRSYTLDEISKNIFNVFSGQTINKERVRQIQAKSLRKLRHPKYNCKVLIKGRDYDKE